MQIKVIGIGAAGNKAAIEAIEQDMVTRDQVKLINSALEDVPSDYRQLAYQYAESKGGCGKERTIARGLALNSLQRGLGEILESFMDPADELVVLVSSSGGGTGAGSAPIIAKYIKDVIGMNVMCFVFTGFEEDVRELQNTVEYFQDMEETFIVQSISNKNFISSTVNKLKAEQLANKEFVKRLRIITGSAIRDSYQNIDTMDLYKTVTTPGYMDVSSIEFDKIKNVDQFNKTCKQMLDELPSLETEKSCKRMAVIVNAKESTKDYIDYNYTLLKDHFGKPYEIFQHIQYDPEAPESISFISSGMAMPLEEVKEIYNKYKQETEKVNKSKDSFFEQANTFTSNVDDLMFNTNGNKHVVKPVMTKDSFFDKLSSNPTSSIQSQVEQSKKNVIKVQPDTKDVKNY